MSPWYTGLDLVTVTKGNEECGPGIYIDQSEADNGTHRPIRGLVYLGAGSGLAGMSPPRPGPRALA